jgi:hypothetical protein
VRWFKKFCNISFRNSPPWGRYRLWDPQVAPKRRLVINHRTLRNIQKRQLRIASLKSTAQIVAWFTLRNECRKADPCSRGATRQSADVSHRQSLHRTSFGRNCTGDGLNIPNSSVFHVYFCAPTHVSPVLTHPPPAHNCVQSQQVKILHRSSSALLKVHYRPVVFAWTWLGSTRLGCRLTGLASRVWGG